MKIRVKRKTPTLVRMLKSSIKRCAVAVGSPSPYPGQNGQAENPQGQRQMGGKDIVTEEMVVNRNQPVGQGWFFQVADAIHLQSHPVAAVRHVLGGGSMVGIGIVEQGWGEERRHMHRGKDQQQKGPGSPGRKTEGILGRRLEGKCEVVRHGG